MKKLTFEEWQKEYGLPTVIERNTEWCLTQEARDENEQLWKEQEQERYDLYCKKVDACNKDLHSNKTYAEAMAETKLHVEETITEQFKREKEQLKNELNHVMQKLNKVEEKNRCIRVRMFDWLSDTFHHWGDLCHRKSVKIDSPCVIRMPKEQE